MSVRTTPSVCMVSFLFFPHYSGAGAQALTLSKKLVAHGTSVMFVTAGFDGDPEFEEYEGFRVFRILCGGLGVVGLVKFWVRLFALLLRHRREFDLIHVHGVAAWQILTGLYGRILGRPTLIKVTMAEADLDFKRRGRLLGKLEAACFRHFSRYIALSSKITGELRAVGVPPARIVTLPNGVNTDRFHPVTPMEKERIKRKLQLTKPKIVTFIGMVIRRKGIDVLIEAWERVIRACPDACLLLIGPTAGIEAHYTDNTFIDSIRASIQRLGLEDHVLILGERQDVELYLQASDVFVLPSQAEGLPNVLLEAMACGLPCITTRVSGTEDVITDGGNGFLVDYGDRESLQARLIQLLRDDELCGMIGANALQTVQSKYALEMIANSYARVYEELLDRHS